MSDADIIFGCAYDVNISSEETLFLTRIYIASLAVSYSLEIRIYCLLVG